METFAQKETFDYATYTAPQGWKKDTNENAIQFTKEDAATGAYCAITLFKAIPAKPIAQNNFDLAWTSVVKEMVPVSSAPVMEMPDTENEWQILSGYSAFDKDGNKGVVVLVTATSNSKMMNLIVLTNTDVFEKEMTAFIESITLQKLAANNNAEIIPEIKVPLPNTNGYTFNTTNFDDGWTSTVQEDWVEVKKENIKVLLHYPNKGVDSYSSDLMAGLKYAWDVLIAPRYSSATDMDFKPLYSWQSIEYAEASMVEKVTGQTVYVVFFKKHFNSGAGKYIEFIATDKNAFEKEFAVYSNQALAATWDKLANMANYNKFAVSAADLNGKWTSDFSGMTQYVNAYTGADAGANTHASNESYQFFANNSYKWDLGVASGFVGNIKFQSAKAAGKFTMLNNWQIKLSDIEGKPKIANVQLVCIKGARVLWIGDTRFGKN